MNKAYKSIYNESTGTFVAVSENAKARGKRASSRVISTGKLAVGIAAGALFTAGALADVDIPQPGNAINFTAPGGSINFNGAGTINASSGLTLNGQLTATGITVGADASLASGSMQVVTGRQLFGTNARVADAEVQITAAQSDISNAQSDITAAQTNISAAQTRIAALEGQVDDLGTSITTNSLDVANGALVASSSGVTMGTDLDMDGNKITGLADGDINAGSTDAVTGRQVHNLFIEEGANGVRYFRANSIQPDSQANGQESIAVGPNTVAEGDSSFAAGDGASTTETAEGSIALGQNAEAGSTVDGTGAIAIGRDSIASRNGSVALGDGAQGSNANVTAVGAGAQASSLGATALGAGASASGSGSISIGGAEASADNAFAAGTGAYANTSNSIALGVNAGVGTVSNAAGDRTNHIAIGTGAGQNVAGNQTTAIGYGAGLNVTGDDNVALGTEAGRGLQGNNNISIGLLANDGAGVRAQAIAIGGRTQAGSDSVALGDGAQARGSETLALGKDASAEGNGVAVGAHAHADGNSIALGRNSAARVVDAAGSGYLTGSVAPDSVVSVGNADPSTGETFQRRIVNVADGSQAYDAVNVRQLRGAQTSVATLVGGGVTVNADGTFSPITVLDTNGDTQQFNTIVDAIGAVTSGAVDILPVDAVRYNGNGGISNVTEGINATDAVNVGQLNQAIADSGVKYYSANTNIAANRTNNGATGQDAMAIGPAAVAGGDSSLAIGHAARVNDGAHNGVAIGRDVSARAANSTVLGNSGAAAYDQGGVAIGERAVSRGQNSIVMGTGAEADPKSGDTVDNAVVIGTEAEATADDGIAIGQSALASDERAVAQGYDAHATADDAQAFGTRARASAVSAQASGMDARASGVNSIATGTDSRAYAADGIAIGTGAVTGLANPPLGEGRRNLNGIAVGNTALADYENAMALGVAANARAESATAVGDGAEALALNALAVGTDARVTGVSASAFGRGAEATALNASAIGQGAQAAHQNSVALGSAARTAAAVGTANSTIDKVTYNYAGFNPVATVSVGTETDKRTITNVAAGRISESSTDAINGSQLYGTNMALNALADDLDTAGGSIADVLGGDAAYDPDTHQVTMSDVGGTGKDTVHDAIAYAAQGWNVSANGAAAQNVAPGGTVDFSNDDGNIEISRNGTDLAFNLAENIDLGADGSVTTGDTVMNGSGVQVGGHVSSNDPSTAVGAGVITIEGSGAAPNTIVIHGERGDITGLTNTDLNGGDFAQSGRAATEEQLALVNQTANAGWNVAVDGEGALADGSNKVGPAGVVDFSSDDGNIVIERSGTNLAFSLAKDLTGLDSITINNGGPVINVDGINMGGKRITNVAPGQDGTDAVNVDQLTEVNDVANMGWNVSVGGEGALADGSNKVGPGGTVDFDNSDNNIVIERDGSNLTFNLAENIDLGQDGSLTTGATVVNNDGVAVGNDVALTNTGLAIDDGAGNSTTTTVAGTTVTNAAGDTTTVGAGRISVADAAGNETTVGGTQVVVGGGAPITLDGAAGRIGGLTNITFDPDNYTSGQAATEDQLKQVSDVASAGWHVTDADGNTANIGPDGVVTFEGDGNIAVAQTGDDQDGVVEITLNKDIDLGADGSLKTGDTVVNNTGVSVGGDVHLGSTGLVIAGGPSVTTAGINAGNMVITNVAPGVNDTDAVNYGQLRPISEFLDLDASGTFAYNGSQHSTLKDALDSMHWNVEAPAPEGSGSSGGTGGSGGSGGAGGAGGGSGNGGSGGTPIHNSNTVGFVAGDNIVITKSDRVNDAGERVGADIKVAVSQDLNVTSITAVNVQADEIQISNGGPVINENGIDMSGKPITNVAAGVNETDAVNVGQLQQAAGNLQGQVNSLRNDVRRLDNRLSAGVAAAMATAALPQAYLPGKNMMAMAGGTWNGESGMAIGFSGITDNGKWVYKLSGNATSRGDYGGAVGVGYQW